jgi:predicted ATP-grasp superfamily ATP-dependent carboligase
MERHAMTPIPADKLVILGSGVTALAVARCAHRLGMQPVIFDTATELAASSRLVRAEIHPEPWCDSILAALLHLGDKGRSLLISTADAWLQFLILHRPQLESAYARILHPPSHVLSLCLDKGRFADWCMEHGLPAPRRFHLNESGSPDARELPYPLMVRPAETLHSTADAGTIKAVEVHTREELDAHLKQLTRANRQPVLCESLLGRPLVQHSVGFARHGAHIITVVARKLRPRPEACGPGTLVETADNPAVDALARQVALLLDYQGIGEIEILEDTRSGEYFLIEVNPRPWLQFALGAATGRDLLGLVTRNQPQCTPRGSTARWLDLRADLRACFRGPHGLVRTHRLGAWAWLRSIASANVFARWSAADQRPFWREMSDMLRAMRRRSAAGHGTTPAGGSASPRRSRSWRQPGAGWRSWSGSE